MDLGLITDQFMKHTSVQKLDQYRRHLRKFHAILYSSFNIMQVLPTKGPIDRLILTGSTAEGASLARRFSADYDTTRESEIDLMFPLLLLNEVNEDLLHYIPKNSVFAHMKADSALLAHLTSTYGEAVTRVCLCLFSRKVDGLQYLNSNFVINTVKLFELSQSVFQVNCDTGHPSIKVTFRGVSDDDDLDPDAAYAKSRAHIARVTQQTMSYVDRFKAKYDEMLKHLQILEKEFLKMRSGEVRAAMLDQVAKALEWTMQWVDLADVVCDMFSLLVQQHLKCDVQTEFEHVCLSVIEKCFRFGIKKAIRNYVDQLVMAQDESFRRLSGAKVLQILSGIKRFMSPMSRMLRQLAELYLMMFKVLDFIAHQDLPHPFSYRLDTLSTSFDLVPCLKLLFWPSVAAEWKTRDRLWPHQSVIDGIVGKGAHLVTKQFCHDDIDFRLSFSVAEIDLATRWSPVQHFVYFVFKSLFYKFIKPLSANVAAPQVSLVNKKYLASYMAKTVMMWTSESVDQSWWTEDNAAECLTVLLLALQSAFECRTLDHYFVSSVNLLDGIPVVLANRVVDTVQFILADSTAVVCQLQSHFENIEIYFNRMPEEEKSIKFVGCLMQLFVTLINCNVFLKKAE